MDQLNVAVSPSGEYPARTVHFATAPCVAVLFHMFPSGFVSSSFNCTHIHTFARLRLPPPLPSLSPKNKSERRLMYQAPVALSSAELELYWWSFCSLPVPSLGFTSPGHVQSSPRLRSRSRSRSPVPKRAPTRRGSTLLSDGGSPTGLAASLCKQKGELQTLLKLIATLWKPAKISGVCLVNSFADTTSCPENNCM